MLEAIDKSIYQSVPVTMNLNLLGYRGNLTLLLTEAEKDEVSQVADPDYEQFLTDVWVGIILTLMVLSCVCCMCSCLLYHKFQQWKHSVAEERRRNQNMEFTQNDTESLPSYTIVSGLPSYDEALEQLRQCHSKDEVVIEIKSLDRTTENLPTSPAPVARLSVSELFQFYKSNTVVPSFDVKS